MSAPTSGEALAAVFRSLADVFRAAGQAMLAFLEAVDRNHKVRRAAIERHGITEADIRYVDGTTVITWNRRRIPIDIGDPQ